MQETIYFAIYGKDSFLSEFILINAISNGKIPKKKENCFLWSVNAYKNREDEVFNMEARVS